MAALFPRFLVPPPGYLCFVSNVVVVGTAFARLCPSGSQACFPGKGPDGHRSYRCDFAQRAL
eukprot:591684-Heterocapsa_arctica.AAC.1